MADFCRDVYLACTMVSAVLVLVDQLNRDRPIVTSAMIQYRQADFFFSGVVDRPDRPMHRLLVHMRYYFRYTQHTMPWVCERIDVAHDTHGLMPCYIMEDEAICVQYVTSSSSGGCSGSGNGSGGDTGPPLPILVPLLQRGHHNTSPRYYGYCSTEREMADGVRWMLTCGGRIVEESGLLVTHKSAAEMNPEKFLARGVDPSRCSFLTTIQAYRGRQADPNQSFRQERALHQ